MFKTTILFFILVFLTSCKLLRNQEHDVSNRMESFGSPEGSSELLSKEEAELLNRLLEETRGEYDLYGKNIAFITGSSGNKVISKVEFFDSCIYPWTTDHKNPSLMMLILSEEDHMASGGYDVLLLVWVKAFSKKQKNRIVQNLNEDW